mgnify:FL=1
MSASKIERLCDTFERLENFVRGIHAEEIEEWTLVAPGDSEEGKEGAHIKMALLEEEEQQEEEARSTAAAAAADGDGGNSARE